MGPKQPGPTRVYVIHVVLHLVAAISRHDDTVQWFQLWLSVGGAGGREPEVSSRALVAGRKAEGRGQEEVPLC